MVSNNTNQSENNVCSTSNIETIGNVSFSVIGSNNSTLEITQKIKDLTTCQMSNSMETAIFNSLTSQTENKDSDALGAANILAVFKAKKQVNNIDNEAYNDIKQVLSNTCMFNDIITAGDINVSIINSNNTKFVIDQDINNTSNCMVNNAAKMQLTNSLTATASNSIIADQAFIWLIVAGALVIILGALIKGVQYYKNHELEVNAKKDAYEQQMETRRAVIAADAEVRKTEVTTGIFLPQTPSQQNISKQSQGFPDGTPPGYQRISQPSQQVNTIQTQGISGSTLTSFPSNQDSTSGTIRAASGAAQDLINNPNAQSAANKALGFLERNIGTVENVAGEAATLV